MEIHEYNQKTVRCPQLKECNKIYKFLQVNSLHCFARICAMASVIGNNKHQGKLSHHYLRNNLKNHNQNVGVDSFALIKLQVI